MIRNEAKNKKVGAYTLHVLESLAEEFAFPELIITSGQRTPADQARAMYDNIIAGRLIKYKWPGEAVCNVCRSCRRQRMNEADTLAQMIAKIEQLSAQGARVSLHCVSDQDFAKLNVIDISYKNIPEAKRRDFILALKARPGVVKVLQPFFKDIQFYDGCEPAIHIEVEQIKKRSK